MALAMRFKSSKITLNYI